MNPIPPLRPGSAVQVVAPSGVVPREAFDRGVGVLRGWGLEVRWAPRVFDRRHYLAGPDGDRAREWVEAFRDPGVAGVLAARGGFGAMRILEAVDARPHRPARPRLFMGFSDLTALHVLRFRQGCMGIHGANVTTLAGLDAHSLERTRRALFGEDPAGTFRWEGLRPIRGGRGEGRLIAGNLSLICALMGTRFEAPMAGCIWVVEDVHEPPYRLDRLLVQVGLARQAGRLRGLVVGDLGIGDQDPEAREAVAEALDRLAGRIGCPVVGGFPAGHRGPLHPVPVGAMAALDGDQGVLQVIEDPCGGGWGPSAG
ncbi:MAG TPA: LD-carboxypeptidase [Myxococcota bacterium]|nr:LD-carboxypeptidase [Myxococcota bacterium]HQK50088.1 LD-carboxypeptidase [Myxococcota bacterium]